MPDQFHRRRPQPGDRAEHKNGQVVTVKAVVENMAAVEFDDGLTASVNVGLLTWLPSEAEMKADRVREMEKQLATKRRQNESPDGREGSPHEAPEPPIDSMLWDDNVGS